MAASGVDERVILLAPTRRDGATTVSLFERADIAVIVCATFDELLAEILQGAAVVIVPEENLTPANSTRLARIVHDQAPWSDLPILVLAYAGATSPTMEEAVRTLGNVTVLERPLRVPTLLSAVRTAIRARRRQYELRNHLAERMRHEQALQRADERKDAFLATLGHELRNPLAPLVSGMHLLRLGTLDEDGTERVLTLMERQVMHVVRLVDDLLEVSRITRGLMEVRRHPLDLVAIVRGALEAGQVEIAAAGHELRTDITADRIPVSGDPVRLTQVFANLLTNAVKYTNTGGVIQVSVSKAGDRAIVSVCDNGIGIPRVHLASIFEMFTQVDRSSRRVQGGLGIGLTLVRTLVEMHGGRVEARSDGSNMGSEFVVELPVLREDVVESGAPETLRQLPNRRVLIVDDNEDAADTMGALLEALGVTVSVAHSGREALDVLTRFEPDTMLVDIGMPEMDGYELARRIRAVSLRHRPLLIALTGWGQDDDYDRSRAAGFDHHLVKPPDIERLRDLLIHG
jgi:signal transduction histidine kinase